MLLGVVDFMFCIDFTPSPFSLFDIWKKKKKILLNCMFIRAAKNTPIYFCSLYFPLNSYLSSQCHTISSAEFTMLFYLFVYFYFMISKDITCILVTWRSWFSWWERLRWQIFYVTIKNFNTHALNQILKVSNEQKNCRQCSY